MKILIVRHGDPDYSIDSLTPKGRIEAELLSGRLSKLEIRDFYCSPLGRARDTAAPTLKKMNRKMEILPWLHEFRGTVIDPITAKKRIPWNLAPQYWMNSPMLFDKEQWVNEPFMSTGNVREIYEEAARGVDELLARYGFRHDGLIFRCEENTRDTIVLFCHFGMGMVILSHLMGISVPVMWQCFFMPTSSVTTLITEERVQGEVFFKCMSMGDTAHLYAAGEPVSRAGLFAECYGDEI